MTAFPFAIGGYTDTLTLFSVDPSPNGGKAQVLSKTASTNASWLLPHPTVPNVWFATCEVDPGQVRVVRLVEGKELEILATHPTGGVHTTHLAVSTDGTDLFAANYTSGDLSVIGILPTAPYLGIADGDSVKQEPAQVIPFAYVAGDPSSAFNPSRQESSHPHQVLVLPAPHDEVLVPDLGSDKVWRLQKTGDRHYVVHGFIPFVAGSGPRHAAFFDGTLYTVCELSNQLAAHTLPPLPASPTLITYLPTLLSSKPKKNNIILPSELVRTSSLPPPHGEKTETEGVDVDLAMPPPAEEAGKTSVETDPPALPTLAAEILAPEPLVDGALRLIYVSNRNEIAPATSTDVGGDSVAVFKPLPNFELVQRVRTGVNHARGVALSPDARHILVAGQNGGGVALLARGEDGSLKFVRKVLEEGDGGIELPTSVTVL